MKNRIVSLATATVLIASIGNATDYYVSSIHPNRSDSNSGTSSNAPWATFGYVKNRWSNLQAGDTVHLERGSQWELSFSSDYWNVYNGGTAQGGHITLRGDQYGSGAKPILHRNSGVGECAFISIQSSYVTVRDIELDGGNRGTSGIILNGWSGNVSDIHILNMMIHNLGGGTADYICGIWAAGGLGDTTSDCLIEGNYVADYSAHGLNHYSPHKKINIIWRNNIVINSQPARFGANSALQIGTGSENCVFEYNYLQDTTVTEGNIFAFGKYSSDTGNNIIRFNVITRSGVYGILFSMDHTGYKLLYDVYGNIIYDNGSSGIAIYPNNTYGSGTRLNFYNNTIVNNCTRGGDATRGSVILDDKCINTTIDFANNLIYHRNYGSTVGLSVDPNLGGTFIHRNNLYWHEDGTAKNIINDNQIYTVAEAKAYESTAQNSNPLLKNSSQPPTAISSASGPVPDGLSLATNSPAIGAGADLGSNYALDINRTARSVPWTIGAYQEPSEPSDDDIPPTVAITAPAAGATVSGSATTVSATATDNVGVVGVQFKLDGANLGAEDTSAPFSALWNTTSATNGSHTLTAVARDANGNTKTSEGIAVTVYNELPPPDALISTAGTWQNQSFAAQTNLFTAEFDAVPTDGNIDGATGLCAGNAANYDDLAVIVRFHSNGLMDVRNGDIYTADTALAYVAGETYHVRMVVDLPAHTYSVYVQPGSDPEVLLADSYAFRTSQSSVASLDTLAMTAEIGSHWVSGFSATSETIDITPPVVSITAPTDGSIVSGSATTVSATATDNEGVIGVQFKLDGADLGAENTTAPFSITWDTTSTTNASYTLTAVARDANGNTNTSEGITVTVYNAPPPPVTLTSTVGTWQNQSFTAQTNLFVAKFDAVPNGANIDASTGLCAGNAANYDDLAVIVRFHNNGLMDVRNGDIYTADTPLAYIAGETYHVRMVVDLPAHTYSVYVQPGSDSEVLLADSYAFRTSQSSVTSLDTLAMTAEIGTHEITNVSVKPIIIPSPPSIPRVTTPVALIKITPQ